MPRAYFTPRPPPRKPKKPPSRSVRFTRPITATRGGRTAAYAAKATYTKPKPASPPVYTSPYAPGYVNKPQVRYTGPYSPGYAPYSMEAIYNLLMSQRAQAQQPTVPTFSGHKEAQGMWPDLSQNTISRWARRLRQGYRWRYLEDYPQYEEPLTYQEPPDGGYGGYGGYGYGGGGGGGYTPAEPEPPKQYGSVRTSGERNLPQWLMDMVVWNI